jgi:DNA-binding transcriptional regulator GbsR (MarR family)
MERQNSNALVKIRAVFVKEKKPLTLSAIREKTNLTSAAISMALCHLRKQRYVTRELVANNTIRARKTVWSYEYHPERINADQ